MYIDIPARTLEAWGARLTETELAAVKTLTHCWNPEEELTPEDVLTALVAWNGGVASAFQVKTLIDKIYGIKL